MTAAEKTAARTAARLDSLIARGFDRSTADAEHLHVKCSQCQALVINGTATHETGCPNATKECRGCDALIPARSHARYCADCS